MYKVIKMCLLKSLKIMQIIVVIHTVHALKHAHALQNLTVYV